MAASKLSKYIFMSKIRGHVGVNHLTPLAVGAAGEGVDKNFAFALGEIEIPVALSDLGIGAAVLGVDVGVERI